MRDVLGYEKLFSVTEDGEVYSKRTNKILKQVNSGKGYLTIPTKIGGRDGVYKTFRVHRMVAEAYIENPHKKPFVNHLDGDKHNNKVSNLEWCTAKENFNHAMQIGLYIHSVGEANGSSKLTKDKVLNIRERYTPRHKKDGARALSRELGVSHKTILQVVNKETWKHI